MKDYTLNVRMSKDFKKLIDKKVKKEESTISAWVIQCIKEGLKK